MRQGSEGCRGPIAQQCGSEWNSQCTWVGEWYFLSRFKAVLWDRGPWGPKQLELCAWPSCGFLMQGPQYSDDFGGNMSLPPAIVWLPVLRLGFATAVRDVLSIKEDGLLAGGPPCGPWIWINAATHCRKKWSIFGDTTKEYVAASNVSIWQYQSIFSFFVNPSLLFRVVTVQATQYRNLGGKLHWELCGGDEVNTSGICRVWPRIPRMVLTHTIFAHP